MFSIAVAVMRVKFNNLYNRIPGQQERNWKREYRRRVSRLSRDLSEPDPEEQKEPFVAGKEEDNETERLDSTWI